MFKKILISIIILYFLVLVQTCFVVPNFALIFITLWNIFEKPKDYSGIYIALIGGFFLDVFSSGFIGFYILILFCLAVLMKLFFRKYVQIPFLKE